MVKEYTTDTRSDTMNDSPIQPTRAKPRNILLGVVPTVDTFDAATLPGDLEKATNGNFSDPSGTGTKVVTGNSNIGCYYFDLGTPQFIDVGMLITMWMSAGSGTMNAYVERSSDGTYGTPNSSTVVLASSNATAEANGTRHSTKSGIYTRYFRIRVAYTGSSATCNVKLDEAFGHHLG